MLMFTVHEPAIICLQAGNVNTGAFDPLGKRSCQSESTKTWFTGRRQVAGGCFTFETHLIRRS
jgi:hypothetical protein